MPDTVLSDLGQIFVIFPEIFWVGEVLLHFVDVKLRSRESMGRTEGYTGKGQVSFQSQRRAMPKNAQTTAQLHSSHTLVKYCSNFSKSGFNNMWIVNFQMCKLALEKAEDQRSNCHWKHV